MMSQNNFLIQVRDLKKYFYKEGFFSTDKKPIRAVDGISFSIRKGETLGLVGESGCGKTTAGKSILRLIEPTSGQVLFKGQDILGLHRGVLRALRLRMQFIFQDPYESLNPRMKVEGIVGEGLEVHRIARGMSEQFHQALEGIACLPWSLPCVFVGVLGNRVMAEFASAVACFSLGPLAMPLEVYGPCRQVSKQVWLNEVIHLCHA